jgi:hypothetical protein
MDATTKLVVEIGVAVLVLVIFRDRIILALAVLFLPKWMTGKAIEKAVNDRKTSKTT